jgi:hypothetical protein
LRNFVDGNGASPFEARLAIVNAEGRETLCWITSNLKPPLLMQAAELLSEGMSVREVAAALHISKSEVGRLRLRAITDGILVIDADGENDDGSDVANHTTTIQ